MKIVPVLEAAETILKADIATKDIIGRYYYFEVPNGAAQLPICVLSVGTPNNTTEQMLGGDSTSMPYFTNMTMTITILGRAYAYGMTYETEMRAMDIIQDKICTVLNKRTNNTLSGTAIQQTFQYLRPHPTKNEYCGFEIGFIVMGRN